MELGFLQELERGLLIRILLLYRFRLNHQNFHLFTFYISLYKVVRVILMRACPKRQEANNSSKVLFCPGDIVSSQFYYGRGNAPSSSFGLLSHQQLEGLLRQLILLPRVRGAILSYYYYVTCSKVPRAA